MSVIRVEKTEDYTVMSNAHLKEKEMSLKAKGLMSLVLSLPDGWGYSVSGLTALSQDGKSSVMSAIEELKSFGYLEVEQVRKGGQFEYIYTFYESPNPIYRCGKTDAVKPMRLNRCGKTESVNQPLLNTNELNTYKSNTEISSTENKDERCYFPDEKLDAEFREYIKYRKQMKKPLTEHATELCMKKLAELSGNNTDVAIRVLQQSMSNGWTGLFALKEDKPLDFRDFLGGDDDKGRMY